MKTGANGCALWCSLCARLLCFFSTKFLYTTEQALLQVTPFQVLPCSGQAH